MELKPIYVTIYRMYIHEHIILDDNCKKLTQFIDFFLGLERKKSTSGFAIQDCQQ